MPDHSDLGFVEDHSDLGFIPDATPRFDRPFEGIAKGVMNVGMSAANLGKQTLMVQPGIAQLYAAMTGRNPYQELANTVIEPQLEQGRKAKEEFKKGNYGYAARRGLAAAVPMVGPMIETFSEKAQTKPWEAGTELALTVFGPKLLSKAAEIVPRGMPTRAAKVMAAHSFGFPGWMAGELGSDLLKLGKTAPVSAPPPLPPSKTGVKASTPKPSGDFIYDEQGKPLMKKGTEAPGEAGPVPPPPGAKPAEQAAEPHSSKEVQDWVASNADKKDSHLETYVRANRKEWSNEKIEGLKGDAAGWKDLVDKMNARFGTKFKSLDPHGRKLATQINALLKRLK